MAQWAQKKPYTKVNLLDVGGPCVVGFEGIPGVVFVVGPAVFGVVMGGSPGVVICVDFVVVGIPGVVIGGEFLVVGNPGVVICVDCVVVGIPDVVMRVDCVVVGIPGVVLSFGFVVVGIPGVVMGVDFAVVVCFCQQFYIVKIIICEITYRLKSSAALSLFWN